MIELELLKKRKEAIIGELGAINAFLVVPSRSSVTAIVEQTKNVDSLGVEVRKELRAFRETLVVSKKEPAEEEV